MKLPAHTLPRKAGIAIIGPGRVGQAMGKLLRRAGYPVRFVAARRPAAARRAVRFIGGGRPVGLRTSELANASVILVTTSDAAIASVAQHLASLRDDWSGKVVLHTCGSLSSGVVRGKFGRRSDLGNPGDFRALRRRGAAVGSLHPFQTIPNPAAGVRNLVGCFWAVEGDPAARRVASAWVKALRGVTFQVRSSQRTLYHLSAFLVCPTIVTLMDQSLRLLERSGVPAGIARPMLGKFVAETAKNCAELGARRALTGPAARGDWPTIRRHLMALRRVSPGVIPVYTALLRAMLRLIGRRPPPELLW